MSILAARDARKEHQKHVPLLLSVVEREKNSVLARPVQIEAFHFFGFVFAAYDNNSNSNSDCAPANITMQSRIIQALLYCLFSGHALVSAQEWLSSNNWLPSTFTMPANLSRVGHTVLSLEPFQPNMILIYGYTWFEA